MSPDIAQVRELWGEGGGGEGPSKVVDYLLKNPQQTQVSIPSIYIISYDTI